MLQRISGYKTVKEIGHGGMSTVYLAVQTSVNRYVALKVMSPHLVDDETFTKRFLTEARIAARFRHPNIISILDVNVSDGVPYIAMEYVPGGELNTERIKSMTMKEKLSVLVQIADALGFLHKQNFVHRDIKPANILFREDKSVVLTDFGVARDQTSNSGMTLTGYIIGTPHYLSPEQAQGGAVDARSDLYSLGVLTFRILSERLPYIADDAIALCTMHVTADIPDLPEELAKFNPIIKKAMAKAPEERYQTADEFIDELIAVTGSKTAKMLRRSVEGVALEAIRSEDIPTTRREQVQVSESDLKTRQQPSVDTIFLDRENVDRLQELRSKRRIRRSLVKVWQFIISAIEKAETKIESFGFSKKIGHRRLRILVLATTGFAILSIIGLVWKYANGTSVDAETVRQRASIDDPIAATAPPKTRDKPNELEAVLSDPVTDELVSNGFEALERGIYMLPEDSSALGFFRRAQAIDPQNLQAKAGLRALTEALVDLAFVEISNGRTRIAQQLISDIELVGTVDPARLDELESALAKANSTTVVNAMEIDAMLMRGNEYLEKNQLTLPEHANAVSEFNEVLLLDKNNAEAIAGLGKVGERYLVLARDQLSKGNLDLAEEYWSKAVDYAPQSPELTVIREAIDESESAILEGERSNRIQAERVSQSDIPPREIEPYRMPQLNLSGNESIDTLHKQAEQAMKGGNRMKAYALYKAVWSRDPDFGRAGRRLNSGAGSYINVASREILKGDLFAARENLSIALALDASHPKFDTVRRDYLAAIDKKMSVAKTTGRQSIIDIQVRSLMAEADENLSRFEQDPANLASARKARQSYSQVYELRPGYEPARNGLSELFDDLLEAASAALGQARKDDALQLLSLASEINPHHPDLTALQSQAE